QQGEQEQEGAKLIAARDDGEKGSSDERAGQSLAGKTERPTGELEDRGRYHHQRRRQHGCGIAKLECSASDRVADSGDARYTEVIDREVGRPVAIEDELCEIDKELEGRPGEWSEAPRPLRLAVD